MLNLTQKLRHNREEGFSLVELMVAVAIMGILAAIAIPAYMNQRKTAIDSTVVSDVKNAATQVETGVSTYPTTRCIASGNVGNLVTIKFFAATTCTFATTGQLGTLTTYTSEGGTLLITGDPYSVNGFSIVGKNLRGNSQAVTGYTFLSNKGGMQ